jgi:hypothetical protein
MFGRDAGPRRGGADRQEDHREHYEGQTKKRA